jgi:hypothetical protein
MTAAKKKAPPKRVTLAMLREEAVRVFGRGSQAHSFQSDEFVRGWFEAYVLPGGKRGYPHPVLTVSDPVEQCARQRLYAVLVTIGPRSKKT